MALTPKGYKTKLVSHFGGSKNVKKRGEDKKKRRRKGRIEKRYGYYGFVWNCYMDGYVFVWNLYGSVCMDISGSISRV